MSCVRQRLLPHAARLVKRHVQEVQLPLGHVARPRGGPRLAAANHALDALHLGAVDLPGALLLHELLDVRLELRRLRRVDVELLVELGDEIHEADRIVVEHRDVAGRLVGDVHLVPLVDQPDERAAHRDHVVVRMRREDEHALREHVLARARRIARPPRVVRLAARPAGDRPLQLPEHVEVDVVRRPAAGEQILQALLVVVLLGQLEDRLLEPAARAR